MTERAVFLAREGVLCEDALFVSRPQDFHWRPGAMQALKWLQRAHWHLVVVTNQPGIARGLFGPAEYDNLTGWMCSELAGQGVTLDGVYHCPHLPDTPLAAWRRHCECHLPQPALLRRAARDLGFDLGSSVMMGHSGEDIAAANAAGLGARIRVVDDDARRPSIGGTAATPAAAPSQRPQEATAAALEADYSCASLAEAAYWLLAHERARRA
jgi:D-glycero-D-manno-heptose 1,7-bisphosphate phosphatase